MSVFEKTLHIPTVHILRHSEKCQKKKDGVVLQGTNVVKKKKLMASSLPTSTCFTWKVKQMKQFPRWDPPARTLFEIDPYIQQKIQVPKISKTEESSPIQAVWIRLMEGSFPTPKIDLFQVQETLHFRYLKVLVTYGEYLNIYTMSCFVGPPYYPW